MSDEPAAAAGPGAFPISRRTMLIGVGALAAVGVGGSWITNQRPDPGTAFATALKIPPLLEPEIAGREKVFRLQARAGATELVPGVRFSTMGFNGSYLGPTIRATRGERVRIHVDNGLDIPTTAHWHGMLLPSAQDGTMYQSIRPGASWAAAWLIDQAAATLWYHPHPHGQTELQVGRGMAGLFIVDDDEPTGLPSEYGVDDVPIIIQDVTVASGGAAPGTPASAPIGRIGNTVIVNGTHEPHFAATTDLVRFRVLNASAARCYNLELNTAGTFHIVGTDGGLLSAPAPVTSLLLSPAERAEIIIRVPRNADMVLLSTPHDLGMSEGDNIVSGAEDTLAILRITRKTSAPSQPPPTALPSGELPKRADVTAERRFELGDTTINGTTMDMNRIDTVVTASTTEMWTIANTSDRAHNFHVHGTQFAVHTVNGAPPPVRNRGRKDTVLLAPGDTAELIVPFSAFADPTTPYMYHCHMLWHEDQGMMAQYIITAGGGSRLED